MPHDGFFRTVTRYAGRENRMTGALAAVLDRDRTLAHDLAMSWTAPEELAAASGEVAVPETAEVAHLLRGAELRSVDVQVPIRGGQVDLELRFRGPEIIGDVVLWVEVKHGSDPHPDQLPKYERNVPRPGAVVLLAPRSQLPYEDPVLVPPTVPQRSWQAAGQMMREHRASNRIADFLLEELYTYMRNEHLTDPEVLLPEHLIALAYAHDAEGALATLCQWTSEYVQHHWERPADEFERAPRTRAPAYGRDYWEAWKLEREAEWLGDRWLDWNAIGDPAHPVSQGRSLVFVSGWCTDDGAALTATDEDRARAELLKAGVRIGERVVRFRYIHDGQERLAQVAQPQEVLVGPSLHDQAESLGAWIVDGLRALTLPLDQITSHPA